MPTLEERAREDGFEKKERLKSRQYDLIISPELSHYIEQLEQYILKLERRVNLLENRHD